MARTSVTVRVGGECFPPGMKFTLWGDGVTAPSLWDPRSSRVMNPRLAACRADADGAGAAMTYPREWESTLTYRGGRPARSKVLARQWRLAARSCDRFSSATCRNSLRPNRTRNPSGRSASPCPSSSTAKSPVNATWISLSLPRRPVRSSSLTCWPRASARRSSRSWKSRTLKGPAHGS